MGLAPPANATLLGNYNAATRLPTPETALSLCAAFLAMAGRYMAMAGRSPTAAAFVRSALFGNGGQVYAIHAE